MSDTIKEYPHITEYGYIKDGKVYLKGYYEFKDREIGVVRDSDEAALQYFVNRYNMVKEKVQAVKEAIQTSENKGSYLMKLIHMRTYLAQYNGLGDFPALFEEINRMEDDINQYVQKNRTKNLEIKTALLQEAIQLKDSTNWKETSERLKELKANWIKTGSAPKEQEEELTKKFNEALDAFFTNRKKHFAEQQRIVKERLSRQRNIIARLYEINQAGGGTEFLQEVKDLQNQWKEIGKVPKSKFLKALKRFKKEITTFFNNLKSAPARREPVREKTPIEIKKEILQLSEEMLNKGAPFNITLLKKRQNQWKLLGKLPQPEDKDLNLKFRIVCNEIFEHYFLERAVIAKYPDFFNKPISSQLQIQIEMLKESIKADEKELQEFNLKHGAALAMINPSTGTPADVELYQQRN
ncbi:MAG: DUF349 domain-containing protein, partial [Flammeovirgaceae bacterium]|nr:DUF349 domain-containing protein [Flammeovirgaceae bacterium]MDW8288030.1 DUF349 domain-containing protein [Flammeovirgaceae bacterium]